MCGATGRTTTHFRFDARATLILRRQAAIDKRATLPERFVKPREKDRLSRTTASNHDNAIACCVRHRATDRRSGDLSAHNARRHRSVGARRRARLIALP
jgi:hypothetical protein